MERNNRPTTDQALPHRETQADIEDTPQPPIELIDARLAKLQQEADLLRTAKVFYQDAEVLQKHLGTGLINIQEYEEQKSMFDGIVEQLRGGHEPKTPVVEEIEETVQDVETSVPEELSSPRPLTSQVVDMHTRDDAKTVEQKPKESGTVKDGRRSEKADEKATIIYTALASHQQWEKTPFRNDGLRSHQIAELIYDPDPKFTDEKNFKRALARVNHPTTQEYTHEYFSNSSIPLNTARIKIDGQSGYGEKYYTINEISENETILVQDQGKKKVE